MNKLFKIACLILLLISTPLSHAQENPFHKADLEVTEMILNAFTTIYADDEANQQDGEIANLFSAAYNYARKAIPIRLPDDGKAAYETLEPVNDIMCIVAASRHIPRTNLHLFNYTMLRKAILNEAVRLSEENLKKYASDIDDILGRRDSLLAINSTPGGKEWEEAYNLEYSLMHGAYDYKGMGGNDKMYIGIPHDNETICDIMKNQQRKLAIEFVAYNHPTDGESFIILTMDNTIIPYQITHFSRQELDNALAVNDNGASVYNLIWAPIKKRHRTKYDFIYSPDGSLSSDIIEKGTESLKKLGYEFRSCLSIANSINSGI